MSQQNTATTQSTCKGSEKIASSASNGHGDERNPSLAVAEESAQSSDSERRLPRMLLVLFLASFASKEARKGLLGIVVDLIRFVWKPFLWASLGGVLLFLVALGSSILAICFALSWPQFKGYALWSPLFGPGFIICLVVVLITANYIGDRFKHAPLVIAGIVLFGGVVVSGYMGARDQYRRYELTDADPNTLAKSVNDQQAKLNRLSNAGTTLLNQLQSTEGELSQAKEELKATLAAFEQQRQAASNVALQLERLDEKQRAIALRTQELQSILDGKQPITVDDLRQSERSGLFWGTILGIVGTMLTNFLMRMFETKTPNFRTPKMEDRVEKQG